MCDTREKIISDLSLWIAVFEIKITPINIRVIDFIDKYEPDFPILAINSNFGHKALQGHENLKKPPKDRRNKQGDGSCFNSNIEFSIFYEERIYHPKYNPVNGTIQIPGIRKQDFSDVRDILNIILNYVEKNNVNKIIEEMYVRPNLINMKCSVNLRPGQIVNLAAIRRILYPNFKQTDENIKYSISRPVLIEKNTCKIYFDVPEKKNGYILAKLSQKGKINIFGSKSTRCCDIIHAFITECFEKFGEEFIITLL